MAHEEERRQQQIQLLERENALVRTTRTALAAEFTHCICPACVSDFTASETRPTA